MAQYSVVVGNSESGDEPDVYKVDPPRSGDGPTVEVQYRQSGRVAAPREVIADAFARRIRQVWDDADRLYSAIAGAAVDYELYPECDAASQHLLAIDPNRERAHSLRGIVLKGLGRLDEAADVLSACIKSDPTAYAAMVNLSQVLSAQGRGIDAANVAYTALGLAPNWPSAIDRWLRAHVAVEGDTPKVLIDALTVACAMRGSWRPQLILVDVALQLGLTGLAADVARQAATSDVPELQAAAPRMRERLAVADQQVTS